MVATWEGLWSPLLLQARAMAEAHTPEDELGACAASIILSRTAWEAYVAEFIQWRALPEEIKNMTFDDALTRIYAELTQAQPTWSGKGGWLPMRRVNQMRNALIHYRASALTGNEAPGEWFVALVKDKTIAHSPQRTWERSVCTPRVAVWCCETVASAIIRLESIPERRKRSIAGVKRAVADAMGQKGRSVQGEV